MKTTGSTNYIPRIVPSDKRQKRCTNCGEWYPMNCYQVDSKNPDGHRNDCRACRSERRAELQNGAASCKTWKRKGLKKCGDQ